MFTALKQVFAIYSEKIGEDWPSHLDQLTQLKQFAKDARFQDEVMKVKQNNKNKLAEYLKEATGVDVNPCSLFDIQVGSIRCFSPYLSPSITVWQRD